MTTTPAGRPEPEQAMLKALEDIAPAGPWGSSSRSTIEVLESEDWARVTINVNASKLIGPKVKRYLLAMAPDNVRALVESTASLRAENERLRNDLADALDCKAGTGPTALSSVLAERDALRGRIAELEAALCDLHERFDACSKEPISAHDAYDGFYREIVQTALASRSLQPEHKGV